MSTLEKQQPKKRNRKKSNERRHSTLTWTGLPLLLVEGLFQVCKQVLFFTRAHPWSAALLMCAVFALATAHFGRRVIAHYQENSIPESFVLVGASPVLKQQIAIETNRIFREARKQKYSRSKVMSQLNTLLDSFDEIDQYWVRVGLDKKAQISFTQQVPVMVLETHNNSRFLVGHKMRIMGKLALDAQTHRILRISLPETRLNGRLSASETSKEKRARKPLRNESLGMNIPWLFKNGDLVQKNLPTLKSDDLFFENLIFRPSAGFQIAFRRAVPLPPPPPLNLDIKGEKLNGDKKQDLTNASHAPIPHKLLVNLGEGNLSKKMQRLSEVLADLSSREIFPESIDLNFDDKALIKLTESSQPTSF
jgi:hypothetical protein